MTQPVLADRAPYRAPHLGFECRERGCTRYYATLQGDVLIIESTHGGQRHTNTLSLARLLALAGLRVVPIQVGDEV